MKVVYFFCNNLFFSGEQSDDFFSHQQSDDSLMTFSVSLIFIQAPLLAFYIFLGTSASHPCFQLTIYLVVFLIFYSRFCFMEFSTMRQMKWNLSRSTLFKHIIHPSEQGNSAQDVAPPWLVYHLTLTWPGPSVVLPGCHLVCLTFSQSSNPSLGILLDDAGHG